MTAKKQSAPIGIRISGADLATLEKLCDDEGIGPSAKCAQVIREYLRLQRNPEHLAIAMGLQLAVFEISQNRKRENE